MKLLTLIKAKLIYYIFANIYSLNGLTSLERFLSRFYVLICPTFEDYVNILVHRKRKYTVCALTLLDWVMVLRFALLSYFNEPWIWTKFGDSFYTWGYSRYVFAMFSLCGSAVATVKTSFLVFDLDHRLYV